MNGLKHLFRLHSCQVPLRREVTLGSPWEGGGDVNLGRGKYRRTLKVESWGKINREGSASYRNEVKVICNLAF